MISPTEAERRLVLRAPAFVSRRQPVPAVKPEPPPKLRPEGRLNWRERRERCDRVVQWFHRSQARLSVAALALAAAILAFLHSHGWNLPWNLPEDSIVIQFFEGFRSHSPAGNGDLPSSPRRK